MRIVIIVDFLNLAIFYHYVRAHAHRERESNGRKKGSSIFAHDSNSTVIEPFIPRSHRLGELRDLSVVRA